MTFGKNHAKSIRQKGSPFAFTLVEVMVAMALGTLVFAVVGTLMIFAVRGFVSMGNYNDLDRASSYALDRMSREIRAAADMTSFSTNQIDMLLLDNTRLSYVYDPNARTLTQIKGSTREVLLTQCDFLRFNVYQRNPSNDFSFYPASSPAVGKLIDVSWRCSREILGQKINTESVQTSKIVIRN